MSVLRVFLPCNRTIFEMIFVEEPVAYSGKKNVLTLHVEAIEEMIILRQDIDYETTYEGSENVQSILLKTHKHKSRADVRISLDAKRISELGRIDCSNSTIVKIEKISDLATDSRKFIKYLKGPNGEVGFKGVRNIYEIPFLVNYVLSKKELDKHEAFSRKHHIGSISELSRSREFWLIAHPDLTFSVMKWVFLSGFEHTTPEMRSSNFKFDIIDLQKSIEFHDSRIAEFKSGALHRTKPDVVKGGSVDSYFEIKKKLSKQSEGTRKIDFSTNLKGKMPNNFEHWEMRQAIRENICGHNHESLLDVVVCEHRDWIIDFCSKFCQSKLPGKLCDIIAIVARIHLNLGITRLIAQYYL